MVSKVGLKECSKNMPIGWLLPVAVMGSLVSFMIGIPLLVAGYNPQVLTDSKYTYVRSNVVGYVEKDAKCYFQCNCRLECRPSRPNCRNSWEKQRVCDSCSNPCKSAWVVYSIIPPGPTYSFNAFGAVDPDPLPNLQMQYPLNSTMGVYYYLSTFSDGQTYQSVVYGDTMATAINCFIAGFVFIGLGVSIWLIFFILLIFNSIRWNQANNLNEGNIDLSAQSEKI